jgi:hypothetical protein
MLSQDSVGVPKCEIEIDGLVFQQDGAQAHFGTSVGSATDA